MNSLPSLSKLSADDAGWGYFLCAYKETRAGRSGSEFLFLSLQDATGQVVAKLMTDVDRYKDQFEAGEFVRVEGRGSVYAGLAIYDTMQHLRAPVSTYCVGMAASMGAVLLTAGAKGKRAALPNSQIGRAHV